jgi:ribose 5-phosphate isomerase B
MIVGVGSDRCGFDLKSRLLGFVEDLGHDVRDVGCLEEEKDVDPIEIALLVARQVQAGVAERGILIGSTGAVEAMAANKMPGIRAAVCHDIQCAHQSVEHDDANIMVLGAMVIGSWVAKDLVHSFLDARFFSHREDFKVRLIQLAEMEEPWRG